MRCSTALFPRVLQEMHSQEVTKSTESIVVHVSIGVRTEPGCPKMDGQNGQNASVPLSVITDQVTL